MNADDRSIEELLRMAERFANDPDDDVGVTGQRIANTDAERLIAEGYVNIWEIWHRIVAFRDEALAHAIVAVWIPEGLLDGSVSPDEVLDEDGRYKCVLSSRIWFDEDKLMADDTQAIYMAIEIVVAVSRLTRRDRDDD
jgi:hypothetical protein